MTKKYMAVVVVGMLVVAGCGGGGGASDLDADTDADGVEVVSCPGCLIGEVCYGDGQVNPANSCELCDAAAAADAWSDNDGAGCDDGLFCTVDDECAAGACAGSAKDCADGVACNGDETCDEDGDACAAGTGTCGDGELCDVLADECVETCTGCVIGGMCYGAGQANPANACEWCDVSALDAWSDNDGAGCDDGLFCTVGDACAAGACAGSAKDCADGVACNGDESCDEDDDECTPGTGTCGDGELCDVLADECVEICTGCVIDGTCYGVGQPNPANGCEVCDPDEAADAWTDDDGAGCDDGLFCTIDDECTAGACAGSAKDCADGVACNGDESCSEDVDRCLPGTGTCGPTETCDVFSDECVPACTGCVIDGTCYGAGQPNPANGCEVCDPDVAADAWTDDDGAGCDDEDFCTVGDACAGGTCSGTARDCSDGIDCNGTETCGTDDCLPGLNQCLDGEVCDVFSDTCLLLCPGCAIAGECFLDGMTNPSNVCMICDTDTSTSSWSLNDGVSCGVDHVCEAGVCAGDVGALCGAAAPCLGGLVCDAEAPLTSNVDTCVGSTNISSQIQYYSWIGGSFTAVGDGVLGTVEMAISDCNVHIGPDWYVTARFYDGAGVGGTLLGEVSSNTLAAGASWATFDFSSLAIPIVAGQAYSVVLTNDNARWCIRMIDGNPYPGGTAILSSSPSASRDMCAHVNVTIPGIEGPVCRVPAGGTCTVDDDCETGTSCPAGTCI